MNIFAIGTCRVKQLKGFPEGYDFKFLKFSLHYPKEIIQFLDFCETINKFKRNLNYIYENKNYFYQTNEVYLRSNPKDLKKMIFNYELEYKNLIKADVLIIEISSIKVITHKDIKSLFDKNKEAFLNIQAVFSPYQEKINIPNFNLDLKKIRLVNEDELSDDLNKLISLDQIRNKQIILCTHLLGEIKGFGYIPERLMVRNVIKRISKLNNNVKYYDTEFLNNLHKGKLFKLDKVCNHYQDNQMEIVTDFMIDLISMSKGKMFSLYNK